MHHRVVLPPRQNVEATAIELLGVLGGVLVVSVYKPPNAPVLDVDLNTLFGAHMQVILAGVLNCKHPDWGSRLIALIRCLHDNHLCAYGPVEPTHYPRRRGARPDICLLYTSRCV